MKATLFILLTSLLFVHCSGSSSPSPDGDKPAVIRTGTSFGMCLGIACRKDYTFNGTSVTLTQQAGGRPQPQSSPIMCDKTISAADWDALQSLANFDSFAKQPSRLGCPDCADGGAEYIELQRGDSVYRITFEFGRTIPGFEPLVEALRKQREAFDSCK
ncbi:hypothetical protein [Spirosoma montaniterrae]|uniref:Lipoprotein n=1 Tax=Spirosoma montaniterrae TaxID=1178516 RepID=A0A1P9X1J2_9BACT|nr:hypothetical protein [Spirosoma montaniterrae]AQG81494.1 hypothetical protein AWR27_20560 [Spirosoma montaniterrae]